ncbi:cellulose binding domain-containing protein [Actinoplanes bogorensis]|uniref:Cellulose binding domain-containing protein n=2 Tax=Paractinoplanes bogorensis TaxID=1610840 RepID=A0ABS5YS27_9ACTN|nr:cellulose binding domain-containing protein [Actinoplanes bogorensis]
MWADARSTEHPLETYRRLAGLTQTELNSVLAGYAQRQVTYDYSNKIHFQPFLNSLYGGGFVRAYNGVPVEAVNQAAGHYAIPDALAPSDYGYNKIRLVPSSDGALVRLHFKGHTDSNAYGFVALSANGTPRYGPVSTAPDSQISFQLQPGEKDLYLVVLGAPPAIHKYAFLDGYTKNFRFPYEFGLAGAVPSGFEPGYTKPAATGGGHWHTNGGGWVDNRASVASTAYVGPRAAVYGNATVGGNARIEGLAWVNAGATVSGNAVVKDNAIVQGGVNLSGSVVVGGDAEPAGACGSGTYLLFNPDRGCDGRGGETDVNPVYARFSDAEVAVTSSSPTPTASPTPTVPAGRSCSARLAITGSWTGGFQGEVTVTAGATGTSGWTAAWPLASDQRITQSWGAAVTTTGTTASATNASWNGALAAGATTTFGFLAEGTATTPALACTAT